MSENGARKFDQGKAPITTGLLWRWPRALTEVAKVSAVGAEKYDVVLPDNNCLEVEDGFNRYANACGRHLISIAIDGHINIEKGGNLPPEGREVYHLAQMIWDGLTVLERYLIDKETTSESPAEREQNGYATDGSKKIDRFGGSLQAASRALKTIDQHQLPSLDNPDQRSSGQERNSPNDYSERPIAEVGVHPCSADIFVVK